MQTLGKQGIISLLIVNLRFERVTEMKVCGKKYLVHDHRRVLSRFRLKAPGLMVNVSRVQVPCVIGAITDSHSDVLINDFIS